MRTDIDIAEGQAKIILSPPGKCLVCPKANPAMTKGRVGIDDCVWGMEGVDESIKT